MEEPLVMNCEQQDAEVRLEGKSARLIQGISNIIECKRRQDADIIICTKKRKNRIEEFGSNSAVEGRSASNLRRRLAQECGSRKNRITQETNYEAKTARANRAKYKKTTALAEGRARIWRMRINKINNQARHSAKGRALIHSNWKWSNSK